MIREFSAGGVVVRRMRGRPFVAVVRVRDAVLALPKGHPDGDESAAEAARREVREETGLEADLVEKLDDIRYGTRATAQRDEDRVLLSFATAGAASRSHDHEVQEALWIPLEEAPGRLDKGEKDVAAIALARISEVH